MTFVRSILVLLAAVVLILVPYAWGYALSNHHTTPVIVGVAALLATIFFAFILTRRRGENERRTR
jgi:hypothetical protein